MMDDLPVSDATTLATLRAQLDADPEGTVARARLAWDGNITEAELRVALDVAEPAVAAGTMPEPFETRAKPTVVPNDFTFDGYDPDAIPLDVDNTRFETWADAPGWVVHTGPAIVANWFSKRAPFRRHSGTTGFRYRHRAPEAGNPVRVGLFSDFATGLAHSRYIARQLAKSQNELVFHLGDVYYAGRREEFERYFDSVLEPIFAQSPFYGLPGNHEYYSGGGSYFQSIDARREKHPDLQSQEGSYFALQLGSTFQIIGIDTDYFGHCRFEDPGSRAWLGEVLKEGREAGCVNILLSGNELHTYGKRERKALHDDLRPFLPSIDLIFWGNDHYCAFFDKTSTLPLTSCIGHGGYPYHLKEYGLDDRTTKASSAAPVVYDETGSRYPAYTAMRPELGNNGFVEMTLNADQTVALMFRDWMGRDRARIHLGRDVDGRLSVTRHESW